MSQTEPGQTEPGQTTADLIDQINQINRAVHECQTCQCTKNAALMVLLQGVNRQRIETVDLQCCTAGASDLAHQMHDIRWDDYTPNIQHKISAALGELLTSL